MSYRPPSRKSSFRDTGMSWRINFLAVFFLLLFLSVGVKLFELQVFEHDQMSVMAMDQRLEEYVIPAKRGDILASDGLPLAQNVTLNLIYADGKRVENAEYAAQVLSPLLEIPAPELHEKLLKESQYIPLKHYASDELTAQVMALELAGIHRRNVEKRIYPEGQMLSHVIGYVNGEDEGQYGVEQYYDQILSGKDGYRKREKDTAGRPIPIGLNNEIDPIDGKHLILTIDRSVQKIVEDKLKWGVERASASAGSIIVLDPPTGAVVAMANYPSFDPNNYSAVLYDEQGNFIENGFNVYNNDAVSTAYEPGSVFKLVTMAAALDSGRFERDDIVHDDGKLEIGAWTIQNWDRQGHGDLTLTRCLELSNNVCLAQLSTGMGADLTYRYLQGFGFGQAVGVDLSYEAKGNIRSLNAWGEILTATSGYGQGITATPLQMATAVNALANRGRMVEPFVVRQQLSGEETVTNEPYVIRQVVSRDVAEQVTQMMVSVVERNEGAPGGVDGYRIAGKTGTAQVARKDGPGYSDDVYIVSFVGYAPADAPKFLILVKLDLTPETIPALRWGSQAAAPVFREIAKELFKYYEIPPIGI